LSEQASNPLWGGRFSTGTDEAMSAFGASLPVDQRLWREDIQGSIAHARMLKAQGVIAAVDADAIVAGLQSIAESIERDGLSFYDIADEDIHMSIESELTRRIGSAGKRLHTARSRNDQVATDTRLYARQAALGLAAAVCDLRAALIDRAGESASLNAPQILPGYTHLQRAQPVLLAHHLLAWQEMLERDYKRMLAAYDSADVMPLGSAALAGTTYSINRDAVAAELAFSSISRNSLDAVSDRDFACDLVYASSMVMMHLSRICEELILWSSAEFGFITMSDAYSTGSSIMPQKKNPDFAELARGKTGRVFGDLMALLTTLKGLPLAYNKDMQEDKEGLFDAVDTARLCLGAVAGMIRTMQVNEAAMRKAAQGGFMAATDLADHLVGQGMPFRDAHEVIGRIVMFAESEGLQLHELSLEQLRGFSEAFADDACAATSIEGVVAARDVFGGTAPTQVAAQVDAAGTRLRTDIASLRDYPASRTE
jgi:argininosuccinate lyase